MRRSVQSVLALLAAFLASPALADSDSPSEEEPRFDTYVTRPDIESPRWNFTIYDKERLTPGYWFVAPYESMMNRGRGKNWIGPHIYDGEGQLIWSGAPTFNNTNIHDFRVSNVNGTDMLQVIDYEEGYGRVLGRDYKVADSVYMGQRDTTMNMHEMNFVENGTRLLVLTKYFGNATSEMAKAINHDGECFVKFDGIAEFNVAGWKTEFEWSEYGIIGLEESTMQNVGNKCGSKWDYAHANAVDKCPDGDYVLSTRHADTIYKVSHVDGSIVWRLGGRNSDFEMGNVNFSRQHGVRCQSQNDTHTVISLLDNAKGEDGQKPTSNYSRGLVISLATETQPMRANLEAHYDHPDGDGGYTYRRGNFEILQPSGHALVCWSEHALFTEHSPDGTMLMQARIWPKFLGTYRGYKSPWVGMPSDPPDVVSWGGNSFDEQTGVTSTTTELYVSWNGATEVATWKLYKTTRSGKKDVKKLIATAPRDGFETMLTYKGFASFVFAEALDKDGKVLGQSSVVETSLPDDVLTAEIADEVLWMQGASGSPPKTQQSDVEEADDVVEPETSVPEKEDAIELEISDEDSIVAFMLGAFTSIAILTAVWFCRLGRKSLVWRGRYQPLSGKAEELGSAMPLKAMYDED